MEKEIIKILKEYKEYKNGGLTHAKNELLSLFSVNSRSCGIVRWYENTNEDVCCTSLEEAKKYVDKYNKLAGEDVCYVDKDVWLLYNES